MAQKKTAVGGAENWLPVAGLLVSAGVLPKSLRPWIGLATTGLTIYTVAKRLG